MQAIILPGKTWQFEFDVSQGQIFLAEHEGHPAAEARFEFGALAVSLWFDYSEVPLTLKAKAFAGDRVRVCYLEYRLELYVNDQLKDEEWPFGNALLEGAQVTGALCIASLAKSRAEQPAVIARFQQAEGWHPEEDVWVGDCMPFSHEGVYHVFYLKDRHHHQSSWGKGGHQWAHISSRDLVHWDVHPLTIEIDQQTEGSICTGSILYHDGKYYAFYAVRTMDGSPAPLCCAVSEDGAHFVKSEMNVIVSDKYRQGSVRDPKVFADADGLFHMFVTTSIRNGPDWQGCLAHLTSHDLWAWHEEPEPAFLTEVYPLDFEASWTIEPECADYFYKGGWYYLISRSHCWMSREAFGPWQAPEPSRIPCGNVPKMAFWQDDRIIFVGFVSDMGYAGLMTFQEARQRADGTLEFFAVKEMGEGVRFLQ